MERRQPPATGTNTSDQQRAEHESDNPLRPGAMLRPGKVHEVSDAPHAAEQAIRTAAQSAGLTVTPQELRPLLRALGGRPPASKQALCAALLDLRRHA